MRVLFLVLMILIKVAGFAQSNFERLLDSETGAIVFRGRITFEDLQTEPSFNWFLHGSDTYKPDPTAIQFLHKHLNEYQIVAILGTWCDDSHSLIPKLHRTLLLSDFPFSQHSMFGVDRSKQMDPAENQLYRLEKVPTVIVFKGLTEIGRIVEVAQESIEKDLAKIIRTGKL